MEKAQRGRDVFARYKGLIRFLEKCVRLLPLRMRIAMFERKRNVRGKKGLGIRYVLLRTIARNCGDNVAVYPGAYILNPQNISLGNNISIHPMCYLECGPEAGENLSIDDDVSLAHGVTVMATTHRYSGSGLPIKDQGVETGRVRIGKNVWIGAKATVLCGVTVEEGCVIGANSVVTSDTEKDKVYAGAPARIIKDRIAEKVKE